MGHVLCRATPGDFVSIRRMSGWPLSQYLTEGLCSVEHHKIGAQFWSSVTTDIKNEGVFFHSSPDSVWHFPGSIVCLASAAANFMKKAHVCKPGFVNYGKPTAGGSHRLGSCWNYQRLLEKFILLWESHYMSVLCEMSFPRLCNHFYMDFVLGWTGLPHIQTVLSSRRELLPTFSSFPLPLDKLSLWTDVSVAIY